MTEPAVVLASLDQLKQQLNITRNVHDVELTLYLQSASNMVLNRVVVDLTAIPPEATLATLIIAEHLWQTQRGDSARPGVDDEGMMDRPRGFAMPRRAEQLLLGLPKVKTGPLFSFPPAPAYPAS
jgi:hypothetical protein